MVARGNKGTNIRDAALHRLVREASDETIYRELTEAMVGSPVFLPGVHSRQEEQ